MKYEDFLLNEKINIMLETYLYASPNFIDKLKLTSKNKIGEILYNLFDNEYYVPGNLSQNFVDIGNTEDTITFLSDDRNQRTQWYNNVNTPYTINGRGEVKVGRFAKALLDNPSVKSRIQGYNRSFTFTDKDIEDFVNIYKASDIDANKEFKLVKGEKIAKWYNEDSYANQKGTLGSSCMKEAPDSWFSLYTKNNKSCNLLIYINKDKELMGRALVWKLSKSPCDSEYFMDRVYTCNDSDIIKFKNYADKKGWLYKNKMTYDKHEALLFRHKGKPVFGEIVVDIENGDCSRYPYVDTVAFLNNGNKELSNVGAKNSKILKSIEGKTLSCDYCYGSGKDEDDKCPECSGIKKIVKRKILETSFAPEYKDVV